MRPKLLAAVVAGLVLLGCQPRRIPLVFVNASGSEVQVRYSMPLHGTPDEPMCQLNNQWARVTQKRVTGGNWHEIPWVPAVSSTDPTACTITVEVPAGATLLVGVEGFCSDFQQRLAVEQNITPRITSFTVHSATTRIDLEGWAVAAAFERQRNICVFRHPAKG